MVTKIIMAQQDGELSELIKTFGTFYITSTEDINEKIQAYESPIELSGYLDYLFDNKLSEEVDECIKPDFIYNLSGFNNNKSEHLQDR